MVKSFSVSGLRGVGLCVCTRMPEDNSGERFSPPACGLQGGSGRQAWQQHLLLTVSPSLILLPDVEQLKHLIIHLLLFVRRIVLEGVGFIT